MTHVYYAPVGSLAIGTYPLVFSTSTSNTSVALYVAEYSGMAQASANEGMATAGTYSGTASVGVTTSTDNDWGIGVIHWASGGTAGAGYTLRFAANTMLIDTNAPIHPAGATTPSVTLSTSNWWGELGFGLKHG
jgi:hypothetical protein